MVITRVNGTNKISTIADTSSSPQKLRGAKSSNGYTYVYDNNGNISFDPKRDINISYNHLNLPRLIDYGDGRTIEFTYDSDEILNVEILDFGIDKGYALI